MAQAASRLRQLREAAGLTLRELARQIGENHSNVNFWETSGTLPRSNVLAPMSKALGVTIEELLGLPNPRNARPIGGRLGQAFERASKLPRRQQQKIAEVVEALIDRATNSSER